MAMSTTPAPAFATADLCDEFVTAPVDVASVCDVQIVNGQFRDYGGNLSFSGPISTIRCYENNPLVREALSEPGHGRVLVVDGGASQRCALLGDQLAAAGVRNGWAGVIVNGCVRDTAILQTLPLGVKALGSHPLKSSKRDPGHRDVAVCFGGATFAPSAWVYADTDGVLVSPAKLH